MERVKDAEEDELLFLSEALTNVMGLQWKAAYGVWILPCLTKPERAPAIWAHYDLMEYEDHREQKMLAEKLKDLNAEFKRILSQCLPKRKRKSAQQNSENNSATLSPPTTEQ